jgi:hypothetical protein
VQSAQQMEEDDCLVRRLSFSREVSIRTTGQVGQLQS